MTFRKPSCVTSRFDGEMSRWTISSGSPASARAFGAALGVEVAHAGGGLAHQLDRVLERQEPAVRDAAPAQLVELLADDVLHRDVRDAVVLVDVVDVDDVRDG